MPEPLILTIIDRFIKPSEWFRIHSLTLDGYRLIATKDDQKRAGTLQNPTRAMEPRKRSFGMSLVQPYRDYYGKFILATKILPAEIKVTYAMGYNFQAKATTIDDYSNFGWIRLAVHPEGGLYPNLSEQKQLLSYLLQNSTLPKFLVTRVYYHLQREIHQFLTALVIKDGKKHNQLEIEQELDK